MEKAPGTRKDSASHPVRSRNARLPAELLLESLTAASCSLVITDCQQKGNPVVFANHTFEKMSGYKAGEVLGRSCSFLLGKDPEQELPGKIRNALKGGRLYTAVLRACRKEGSFFLDELSIAPIRNSSGKLTHCIWVHNDITAQKETEDEMAALISEKEGRFSAYMENANEAIWRIDFEPPISLDAPESRQIQRIFDNGVVTEANDATARTYGYVKGKELIGRSLKELMAQSDPKNVEGMDELVRNRFHIHNLVTYEKTSNGTTAIILNNITPSFREGKVRYIWGAQSDISELFKMQEDLKRSKEELAAQKNTLEEKNAALKELIAHIELDKKELKDRIKANVEQVVMPSLEKIRLSSREDAYVEQLRRALEDLTSSFGLKVVDSRMKLTPRETEVCSMVKNGLTSKEIARMLNIALHTVEKHRRNARSKLALDNKGINLRSYLSSP